MKNSNEGIQPPLTEQGKDEGMTPEIHLKIEQAENKWLRQELGRANAELAALKSIPSEEEIRIELSKIVEKDYAGYPRYLKLDIIEHQIRAIQWISSYKKRLIK